MLDGNSKQYRVLILEDSPEDAELLLRRLRKTHLNLCLKHVSTKAEYIDSLANFSPDIVVSDYKLPEFNGLSALALAKERDFRIPFIMVSGVVDDSFAAETLKAGVTDYVLKDRPERLGSAVENALRETERLAAVSETAGMVGHDLRNPLQGIAGAVHLLKQESLTASERDEMLQLIQDNVRYSDAIIRDLLEFSREMQLQPVPTTPKSIVKQALTDIKIPNNITLEDTTPDAPEILADEPKLRRVLTNLISNAIDAMPEGGKLSISSVNTQQDLSISVRDTGTGIPKDLLDRVWTPLHTTKAKGIGLGLPICKRIIEAHGGSISVESTVGMGTTFMLKLPIRQASRNCRQKNPTP